MKKENDMDMVSCTNMEATCVEKRRTLADIARSNEEMAADLIVRADRLLRFLAGQDSELTEQKSVGCMYEDAEMLAGDLSRLAEKFSAIEDIIGL